MAFLETVLNKLSRLTQNPDWRYVPKRCVSRALQAIHYIGIYKIPTPPVLNGFDCDLILHCLPGEFPTRRLWFCGYVYYDEEYFLRSFVRPGMTVIDVGANIGHLSLICGKRVGGIGVVHAFEPLKSTYEILCKNIAVNGLASVVYANRLAVTDRSDDSVRLDFCRMHSNLTSILTGKPHVVAGWTNGTTEYEEVPTVALDDYVASKGIERVDLLKIDIEGAEVVAIEGAREILTQYRPTVICEFNSMAQERFGRSNKELWDVWKAHGYVFFEYNHRAHRLTYRASAPGSGNVTYIGTTDAELLSRHIGARLV